MRQEQIDRIKYSDKDAVSAGYTRMLTTVAQQRASERLAKASAVYSREKTLQLLGDGEHSSKYLCAVEKSLDVCFGQVRALQNRIARERQ